MLDEPLQLLFGSDALLDTIADTPAPATFMGEHTHLVWPADHGLRRIPVTDPTPVYPHSLLWHRDNPHPALAPSAPTSPPPRPSGNTGQPSTEAKRAAVPDVAGATRRQGPAQPEGRDAAGPRPRSSQRDELGRDVLVVLLPAADLLRRPVGSARVPEFSDAVRPEPHRERRRKPRQLAGCGLTFGLSRRSTVEM
ncbi:hypothetical protein BEK98_37300 [Streptomyces diastatochromogenes]|uniref:Uncharacterized protein n=1 Tax=Streptomyces diastatochromogenes TaxID=42236 RepID=A0A233S1Z2_STRDA|nr:hypothetical protein BEK98_37300 [Streptomyces diastatochromogenes]